MRRIIHLCFLLPMIALISCQQLSTRESIDQEFLSVYESLRQNEVLYLPFVDVYKRGDSVVKLYLDSVDYQRLAIYSFQDLTQQNKKVQIEAATKCIRKGYYKCLHLLDVKSMEGETYPKPNLPANP